MAREKLKDFLSINYDPARDKISYDIDQTGTADSAGSLKQPTAAIGDELGEAWAQGPKLVDPKLVGVGDSLVNDFLSYLTEVINYYEIEGGATEAPPLSRTDKGGMGVHLQSAESQGAKDVFVETASGDGSELSAVMNTYSNSQFGSSLTEILSKLGDITPDADEGVGPHSGNRLLPSIIGRGIDSTGATFLEGLVAAGPDGKPIKQQNAVTQVNDVVLSRNRFSRPARAAFAPDDISEEDFESGKELAGTLTSPREFGKYSSSENFVTIDDLENVGLSLMYKALGLGEGESPGTSTAPDDFEYGDQVGDKPLSVATDYSNIKRMNPSSVSAKNTYGAPHLDDPDGTSTRTGRGAFELGGQQQSYGSDYNDDLSFVARGDNAGVLRARAAAVVLAVKTLVTDSMDSLSMLGSSSADKTDMRRGPYILGQAKRFAASQNVQLFQRYVTVNTSYPYSDCVDQGFAIMFGSDTKQDSDESDVAAYQTLAEAPGYWYSIFRVILKRYAAIATRMTNNAESYTSTNVAALDDSLEAVANSGLVGIMNAMASVGDASLKATGGNTSLDALEDPVRPWNVDVLPDGPATRISKSRAQDGPNALSLAWRGSSVPAMYLVPRNVVMAAVEMNSFSAGANPVKGHVTSDLFTKSYINMNGENEATRIPTDVVQRFENALDAEYVPFYFHDVRTNEILTFHAFLDSLSDSFSPDYASSKGYGRVDSVHVYKSTRRAIDFSFYIAATSKEDFNEMWFKINKLVTLVYPQWTQGTTMTTTDDDVFIQPFSQVIGATPLTRVRIGDVIKGNYSRFNLARMFGIGERDVVIEGADYSPVGGKSGLVNVGLLHRKVADVTIDYVFGLIFGSPLAVAGSGDSAASVGDKILRSTLSQMSINGFVNPIGALLVMRQLRSPDVTSFAAGNTAAIVASFLQNQASALGGTSSPKEGFGILDFPILRASNDEGYYFASDPQGDGNPTRYRIVRPYRVQVMDKLSTLTINPKSSVEKIAASRGFEKAGTPLRKVIYKVKVQDFNAPEDLNGKEFLVVHEDLLPNPDIMFQTTGAALAISPLQAVTSLAQTLINEAATLTGFPADTMNAFTTNASEFMHPANNPITRAFENSGGRGLAGVIRSLRFTWVDANTPWEIDHNSRAPKFCKVSVGFDVIHDLPPGIDSSGYNRAPVYNVGDIMKYVAGDPQPDGGRASEDAYKQAGRMGNQALNKDKV